MRGKTQWCEERRVGGCRDSHVPYNDWFRGVRDPALAPFRDGREEAQSLVAVSTHRSPHQRSILCLGAVAQNEREAYMTAVRYGMSRWCLGSSAFSPAG